MTLSSNPGSEAENSHSRRTPPNACSRVQTFARLFKFAPPPIIAQETDWKFSSLNKASKQHNARLLILPRFLAELQSSN